VFFVLKNVLRLVFSLVALSPIIVPLLAIQRTPLVRETDQPKFDNVDNAADILKRFDPRGMSPDQPTKVTIRDAEISAALSAALSRVGDANARVQAAADGVVIQGTTKISLLPSMLGEYVNVEARIKPSANELEVSSLSVGLLSVPGWVIKPVAIYLLDWFVGEGKGEPIYASVRSVEVDQDMITIGVQPPQGFVADVKQAATKALQLDNAEAIRSYYLTLLEVSSSHQTTPVSLSAYLGPLFAVAQERSQTNSPVEENRALILALAMYFGDSRFQALLSDVKTADAIDSGFPVEQVKLEQRHDWVQHFTTTAGIQVAAGSSVSNLIGEAKEVKDTEGPSGFSFTDIAADRAGVRFAEVATVSEDSARALQNALAGDTHESIFFPRVGDLPEGLSEAEFKKRFGDVGAPGYTAQLKKIDGRIAAIPLYK
jgi:hypothetical protein